MIFGVVKETADEISFVSTSLLNYDITWYCMSYDRNQFTLKNFVKR